MSAQRHIADALFESKRLAADIESLIEAVRAGQVVAAGDLDRLRRSSTVIRCHAAIAEHDLARMPQLERRDCVAPRLPFAFSDAAAAVVAE